MFDREYEDDNMLETPEAIEMERTETMPKQTVNKLDSLHSKLLSHYNKGIRKPKLNILSSPMTPETVNKIAVPLYLFTMLATFEIGLFHVMPLMYQGRDDLVFTQQAVVVFLFVEIMMNWLGIRYVDSSYKRFIQKHGDPRTKTLSNGNLVDKQAHSNCSSQATLMTLITEDAEPVRSTRKSPSSTTITLASNNSSDPALEAAKANAEMKRIDDQINSKSINDLIGSSQDGVGLTGLSNSSDAIDEQAQDSGDSYRCPKPTITTDGNTVVKSYSYWSWVPCYDCGRARPPRCHHCPVCRTCVLKRDHHCFFAGSCVGYRNHRFFFVFLIYAFIGCAYATLHGFPYIAFYLWQDMSFLDICFPISVVRFLLGYVSFHVTLSVTTLTLLIYFDFLTLTFIGAHSYLIYKGTTSFEKAFLKSSLEIKDTRTLKQKIRAVLGPYWALTFIAPTHFVFEPEENPITWPSIVVSKH
uniref:Palmitoyltransferase n=1 Tax=Biomphalaria glabrata TaxID=6526 RepID=A0A2C9JZ94_BIOGL